MSGRVFINYRRDDSASATGRLYDHLESAFGKQQLFIDVDHIGAGADFVAVLDRQVAQCDVMLAMIGPRWSTISDNETGRRRLDNPDDFVRIEIESALKRNIHIIPVLVENAAMPREADLPDSLKPLSRRHAVRLTHERFRADGEGLIEALKKAIAEAEADRQKAAEDARLRAEAEQKRQQEQARLDAIANLTPQQIAEAQELASWNFIQQAPNEALLRDHLTRFPQGSNAPFARILLERLVWQGLGANPDRAALEAFLVEFPDSEHASDARKKIAPLVAREEAQRAAEERRRQEDEAWQQVRSATHLEALLAGADLKAVAAFLKKWPNGVHAKEAKKLLRGAKPFNARPLLAGAATLALLAGGVIGWMNWPIFSPPPRGEGLGGAGSETSGSTSPLSPHPGPPRQGEGGRALVPGSEFDDCNGAGWCPKMVVVPAGNFMMGSPTSEEGRDSNEGPQHRVTIHAPFAVGKFEVTFAEWDACIADGGCSHKPEDSWGRGRQPVMGVSWDDIAQQYLPWLSRKTGRQYRLLTEGEWEYVARAGTTGPFSFARKLSAERANYDGDYSYDGSAQGQDRQKTVPVDSLEPNAFGLYNVHGNVWEWVEDCWHDSYKGAPDDGNAWTTGKCVGRVLRGGSWGDHPRSLRSAFRLGDNSGDRGPRYSAYGFRVARSLSFR